jgi:hypothetical protein
MQRDIRRLPRSVSGQQLCHIAFGSARSMTIKEFSGVKTHQVGGLDVDIGLGKWKRTAR